MSLESAQIVPSSPTHLYLFNVVSVAKYQNKSLYSYISFGDIENVIV